MSRCWTPQLNAVLGSFIVAVGAWLAWDGLSILGVLFIMGATVSFLLWSGRTIGLVWAWSTLFLGLECLLWPLLTMVQVRLATSQPSDQEMGMILSAVVMGLFSAVFWLAFSYGLFKRAREAKLSPSESAAQSEPSAPRPRNKRS